jgi:hypothetical protein
MRGAPSRQAAVARYLPGHRRPFESPAGFRLLVPGWPQFSWGQGERGWVLLGSFVVAAGAAVLAWGTWLSWCFFAFGFLVHVSSTTDAIRQASFPVYARRTAVPMIAGSLAVLVYLPVLLTLIDTAWPGAAPDRTQSVYLVNCWAYRGAPPQRGHWVWLRLPPLGRVHAARVVAVAGQEFEWTGRELRVDGQEFRLLVPLRNTAWPQACPLKVPADQVLVEPEEESGAPPSTGSLVLVPQDQIIGRAWAQYYPVWDRRLL